MGRISYGLHVRSGDDTSASLTRRRLYVFPTKHVTCLPGCYIARSRAMLVPRSTIATSHGMFLSTTASCSKQVFACGKAFCSKSAWNFPTLSRVKQGSLLVWHPSHWLINAKHCSPGGIFPRLGERKWVVTGTKQKTAEFPVFAAHAHPRQLSIFDSRYRPKPRTNSWAFPSLAVNRTRALFTENVEYRVFHTQLRNYMVRTPAHHLSQQYVGSPRSHRAIIALGSNVGNRVANIEQSLPAMKHQGIKVRSTSFLYETEAMYYENQDHFLNGVCEVNTSLATSIHL
jgi:hypothetical protein